MDDKRYDALEQALEALSVGEDRESVFSSHPDLEAEIETAQWVQSLFPGEIPPTVIHRSRTRLLSRAIQLHQQAQPTGGIFHRIPRMAYALLLAIVFLISWNGLIHASAQALPGDQLYVAKLTLEKLRLGLALNPLTHQQVEAEYQARRTEEVIRLLTLGRVEFVQFFGIVEKQSDDLWIIDGIEVRVLPESIILGKISPGMTVEVEGATQPDGWVQASEIHLQSFSFTGKVETISEKIWTISKQDVLITPESQIASDIQIGDTVIVDVSSDDFGALTARSIMPFGSEKQDLSIDKLQDTLEDFPAGALETAEPDDLDESDETGKSDEKEEPIDLDETDETDEASESGESDESDEEDGADESDGEDESGESDESQEPDESDQEDEPDKEDEPEDQGD